MSLIKSEANPSDGKGESAVPAHPGRDPARSGEAEADAAEDRDLVARCQSGSHAAFEPLVNRYRGKVYAMIVNMTANPTEAWDLSQEVFVKAWKALPRFENRSGFYTWLYRIVHNVTYDWLRKRKIEPGTEFDDSQGGQQVAVGAVTVPRGETSPEAHLENRELGASVRDAIQQLSPDHRAVILAKEVDGLSYQEIAETLDISIGTVMSRLFYARKKLQALLLDVYRNRFGNPKPLKD